jgi:hypothetical protein
LGNTRFTTASPDLVDPEALRAAWNEAGDGEVETSRTFSQAGDADAGPDTLRPERTLAILRVLGDRDDHSLTTFEDSISDGCHAITAIFAPPVAAATDCHDVWLVKDFEVNERLKSLSAIAEIENLLLQVPAADAISLGEARFIAGKVELAADIAPLLQQFREEGGGAPTEAAVCAPAAGDTSLQEARGIEILNATESGNELELRTFDDSPSGGCQALTVLFHQP